MDASGAQVGRAMKRLKLLIFYCDSELLWALPLVDCDAVQNLSDSYTCLRC